MAQEIVSDIFLRIIETITHNGTAHDRADRGKEIKRIQACRARWIFWARA